MKTIKAISDTYTLSNGLEIPCMGFGTYNPTGGDNCEIIKKAISAGYRYFDTASLYGTERALGQAVRESGSESGLDRKKLFIVSKLWTDEMGYHAAKEAFERSLNRLQTDYLDMYLIHWPKQSEDDDAWKERSMETWLAMEELYLAGKIKGLGLSNFLPHHMAHICANAKVMPVADQLEVHPGYMQEAALTACRQHGIMVQAWSPLGRSRLLSNPLLQKLAQKYGKSPAQICLRFLLQQEIIPLVKASGEMRMKENMDIFDFVIDAEDMALLQCMPQTAWSGEHPDFAVPSVRSNFEQ